MKTPSLILLLVALNAVWSCRPDPKIPQWDAQALTPLAQSRIEISDILPDSNLTTDTNGLMSLVFTSDLAQLRPDEIITPLDVEFRNVIDLQNIDLGQRTVTDFITLGDISKGGSAPGQFIIFNHGNMAPIPPLPNAGPLSFGVDATDIFTSISLQSGDLDVTFSNGMPVPLTNIQYSLENRIAGNTIIQSSIDTLKPQQSITENFSLTNTTIEGVMDAVLQSLGSPGSDAQTVLIDTSDRITVTLKLSNLVPTSATAIFPDQVLAIDTADIGEIKAGNAQLTSIRVRNGRIYLEALSTIEDKLRLNYLVPSASEAGRPLNFVEVIDAAPPGGAATGYREVDVSSYDVDLTGRPTDVGVYNWFYSVLSSRIDSSGRLINLSLQDSVVLNTGILNLTASRGFGYLGKDTISTTESNPIDAFDIIDSGNFDLADARLGISIENYIGAPIDVRLNQMQSRRGGNAKNLTWINLANDLSVPGATLVDARPRAGYLELELNNLNSNFDELLEFKPKSIFADMQAVINGSTVSPQFNQFIFADYGIRSSLFLEVPLHLSADGLRMGDTSEFAYNNYDPDKRVQNGTLSVIADNHFPVQASIDLILLNENGDRIGRLQSADVLKAALKDAEGRSVQSVKSSAEYPLTGSDVQKLQNTAHILFQVSFNTPLPPEKVKIYSDNFMDITLVGDLSIRLN
ncbi:MAG: hypothetical protein U5L96_07660 [Owenweeksia sp.]|nr:hypothetical protein [Owenweeksia sp.]